MSHSAVLLGTLTFEELPLHMEHQSIQALQPSSIEEDEDDPRSLLYLFDDNDFERAAAFLAIEEAHQRAQAAAEALAEAEAQQQRTRALANRLRQLLEEDDELVDMLGRRILATNGYPVADLWQPHHYYSRHGQPYHHYHSYNTYGFQHPSTSRSSQAENPVSGFTPGLRVRDAHAVWDELAQHDGRSDYSHASPFVHAAPVILQGHAPYQSKAAQRIALISQPTTAPSPSLSRVPANTRIAIHPLTGLPMLLVEEDSDAKEASSSRDVSAVEHGFESDEEAGEWAIDDESDLDWLGRELLRRQGGANVWVLGTDDNTSQKTAFHPSSQEISPQSQSASNPSTAAANLAEQASISDSTLPVEVEEVDSDHELANIASALNSNRGEGIANLSSPSQRVAAALARAALRSPRPEQKTQRRLRAATVMSESEEEELETVGRPVEESDQEREMGDDASSLNDRPRKSIKVVDLR
ncbi:uncharacterized protein UTRI_04159_B [Ustilago trichophora]|uniref:Uncharacterized protein n=1 Tax=Ustilago trichophora TaxID=86804 RepID=A0A5C3EBB0_9BASI|nr:uncharacterized protein UTRI_04159_B [Ustilago trichophora]